MAICLGDIQFQSRPDEFGKSGEYWTITFRVIVAILAVSTSYY